MPASTVLSPISATHLNSSSSASAQLILTFNADILAGTGLITISDGATQTYIGKDGTLRTRLIGATDTRTIDITDTSKVTISGDTVTISLDANLSAGKSYSVQMAKGVLLDESGSAFAGLSDTSKLQFTTSTVPTPAATVDSGYAFKYDTGSSASDFITKTALQGVGGKYTGVLAAGDFIEVSLDNGGTWLLATVANDSWSVEGTLTGSSTIIARVSNAEGGHSAAVRHAYTFDNEAAAVASIILSDADFVAGETALVTITFNEAVTGLDLADFAVTGGVLSGLATTDQGKTWTATLTPTINVPDGVGQITLLAGGVADVAGNGGPASATHVSFAYSTVPNQPAAIVTSASMTDTGSSSSDFLTNSTAQTITGKYSGTLAANEYIEVSLDGGTTYTKATATAGNWSIPATTISAGDTLKARVTNGYTYSNPLVQAYTLDQAAPTVNVSLADSTLGIGETSLVTFKFNEAVVNFSNDDVTVSGGTLSAVSSADGGITWSATFTPGASTTDATNAITVNKAGLTDIAGNAGSGSATSANYSVDTVRPSVAIAVADTTLISGETTTVTFTFSEAVTDLTVDDVTVSNGALSELSSADGGATWTATLTPLAHVHANTNVITLDNTAITDLAGNAGTDATSSANYKVTTVRPTARIAIADTTLAAGQSTTVTITFSEAVTGLSTAALSVGHGALSSLTTSDGGITWTGTLTPSASTHAINNVITLNNSVVKNSSGNAGVGTTTSDDHYTVATLRPTATIAVSDTALKAGDTATVTITFTETVDDLAAADFNVANGTLSEPVTTDNGLTWTATLTPTSAIEDTTNSITLDNTGFKDSDDNTGSGTTSSVNYTVDTKAPTAVIALSDSALGMGDTTTVTITFNEAVSDFSNADLTVSGGTLGTLTTSDSITWTATLTPLTTGSGSGSIALATSNVTDAAGNSGPSSASSASFSYTVPPTVTIASVALSADTGTSGDFITATASQTISGTISAALSGSEFVEVSLDGGDSWTALPSFTGTSWTWSGQTLGGSDTLMARVSNGGATGTVFSQAYQLDQSAPTATIALSESALLTGETATVTITFSEAVTSLTLADFKYSGTMSGLTSNSDGTVWTATLSTTSSGEVRLDPLSVTDIAGNSGPATSVYADFTYNAAPTATIATVSMTDPYDSGDFITSSTSQVISGTLSAALGRGQYVEVSLNNGTTWTQATTTGTSWELAGQTISASNTLKVRTSNGTATGAEYSHEYVLDQAAPVLSSISIDKSSLLSGQTATVTVVFDEAVSGLAAEDFAISGASLGTFSTSDNLTWTATLTPTASGSVSLSSSTVNDTAGNSGPVANSETRSFTFTVDNTAPSATLTLDDTTLVKNQTTTLTLTFSEAVTDTPTASDFTVSGGSLGTFTSADGGTTWTTTLTPTEGSYGQGSVILNTGTITDPSNNAGPSSAVSLPFNYDTQTLTLSPTIAFSTDIGSSTSDLITNTGTQTISGSFSGGAIYALMGAKIQVSTDNGETWNDATIDNTAHTWSISATLSGSNYVKVKLTDGSGVTGATEVHAYTIDTTGPGSLASKTPDLSADSDSSNTDAGGSSYDNITSDDTPTIQFSLASTSLTADDYVDVLDTANDNAVLGTYQIQSSDLGAYGGTISVTPENALSEGTHTLVLRARDTAGNTGTQSAALSITIDKTIASMAGKTLDLAAASDSGNSGTDNITNDNTPDVTFNIANTSGLAAGDKLEIIDTANGNDVVYTYTVQAADFSSSGADISVTLDPLSDGAHTLALRAQDKANNTGTISTTTLDITVDTAAPALTSSTPSSGATSIATGTDSITLNFSEALYTDSQTGFKISNYYSETDYREIVFEALSGNTGTYNSSTHAVTLSLSGSLNYGSNYTVAVYNSALADAAGNSIAIGTSLTSFSTPMPSALTLSLTESTYASHSGADNDYRTNNNTLTVSGITTSHLQYKMSSDDQTWSTVTPTGSTYTMTLDDDTYIAGEIQFRQYDVEGRESATAVLANDWTIDTEGPIGYVDLDEFPFFFGLGIGTLITSITGDLEGEFNADEEFIEYTTDGTTWKRADTTTAGYWEINNVALAEGGEIGLRASDYAGNLGSRDNEPAYTVYLGDGYGGNHTATGGKLLYTLYGNDTIDISGTDNTVYAGDGNDAVNIQSGSTGNDVYGGGGSDTINVNGAHNIVDAGSDDDVITISGAHNTVSGSYGADTITISGSVNDVDGGSGGNDITIDGDSNVLTGGDDADTIEVNGDANDIDTGDGGDIVTITGTDNDVEIGSGSNTVTITGTNNTVTSGSDGNTIAISAEGNAVYSGGGADTITISVSSANVWGEYGDDEFKIGTLGSTISGDNGSDTFEFNTSLAGTLSGTYDGGTDGTDEVVFNVSGQTLILANLTSNLTHMERIDLGTNNKLTITSAAIQTMSDTDLIRFEGNSSDTIYADASLWESATWLQILGYNKYQLKSDTSIAFIVDSDIVIDWSNVSS